MMPSYRSLSGLWVLASLVLAGCDPEPQARYDTLIRNATIVDGSGGKPYSGDLAISGHRIAAIGAQVRGHAKQVIDAKGRAVAPGFINMLSWSTASLLRDGRGLSELKQGVTLQVMGEGWSMGPLTSEMEPELRKEFAETLGDEPLPWTSLDEYLQYVVRHGTSQNIASFVGATTVRLHVLGNGNVQPDTTQLEAMQALVRQAMEDGALGVASALIYVPSTFAGTAEIEALARVAGACGGIYITHMRSETDHVIDAIEETIDIARATGTPAEIYHLKVGGQRNWHRLAAVKKIIDAARADGLRITANMYPYIASATGLDAAMPPWVQVGGIEAWAERLGMPEVRARVIAEMRATENDWENLYRVVGGAENMLLTAFKNPALQPLVGMSLAEVAVQRGTSPEETAMDLVIEDGSRIGVAYFAMSEDNLKTQLQWPFMSFGSDSPAVAAEGEFLKFNPHPRAYGTFARVLGRYVRDESVLTLEEAVRRMTRLPADNLGLLDRGRLDPGAMADIVLFDPDVLSDHATFAEPHQYATGVNDVWVNGIRVLADGEPTDDRPGQVVRGRGWKGRDGGGCRVDSAAWGWPGQPQRGLN